jgi:hypothetical protein
MVLVVRKGSVGDSLTRILSVKQTPTNKALLWHNIRAQRRCGNTLVQLSQGSFQV